MERQAPTLDVISRRADTLMITGLVPVLLPQQPPLSRNDLRDPGTCYRSVVRPVDEPGVDHAYLHSRIAAVAGTLDGAPGRVSP
ncbi:hypothetical protein [Streptomyces sp. HPF1205]|uniref:hypothetical protein n=1 Tax=Streptomyces sp. HPF1205 TaxID=2873262 RepID=UPI001CECF9F3|nr:hypothetical protein [Streptomyces sp. HPF1205]